jgi:hypothetical protein
VSKEGWRVHVLASRRGGLGLVGAVGTGAVGA